MNTCKNFILNFFLCLQIFQIEGSIEEFIYYQAQNGKIDNSDLDQQPITEWAFSPVHITNLAKDEKEIYRQVLQYRSALRRRIDLLLRYNQDYVESAFTGNQDVDSDEFRRAKTISDHPLMVYRMIQRFAYNLEEITRDIIALKAEKHLLEKLAEMRNTYSKLPKITDVDQIMENILRIQNVYELEAKDLIVGIIAGTSTGVGLTVYQAYEIGKYALSKQMFTESLNWIQIVLTYLTTNSDQHLDIDQVFGTRNKLIQEHNDLQGSVTHENYYDLNTNRFTDKIDSEKINELKTVRKAIREYHGSSGDYMTFGFMDTCMGINVKNTTKISNKFCYLKNSHHPIWKLSPMKVEVHSWDPYIYQIYDAIGEKVIQHFQDISIPTLSRATVVYQSDNGSSRRPYSISTVRTSSYAFLYEEHNEILMNLEKKIGLMTGLKVDNFRGSDGKYVYLDASEAFQVAVYGFGCHFSEHLDALEEKENEMTIGDRIGSFMVYLNDVELGGYTAFPELGISIAPIKGSALFWYDLLKNGRIDKRMMHGGCPVILGEKWIANKWIRHNANFLNRPCSLNPEE